jgi:hypothetical protein
VRVPAPRHRVEHPTQQTLRACAGDSDAQTRDFQVAHRSTVHKHSIRLQSQILGKNTRDGRVVWRGRVSGAQSDLIHVWRYSIDG